MGAPAMTDSIPRYAGAPIAGFRLICLRCDRHFWSIEVRTDCHRCRLAQWKAFPYADIECGEASGC